MNTLDLQAAAAFLHIHPVTLAGEGPDRRDSRREDRQVLGVRRR